MHVIWCNNTFYSCFRKGYNCKVFQKSYWILGAQNWLQSHATVINQEVIMIFITEFDPSQLKNAQDQAKYETQTSLPRIISFKVFTFSLS